MTSRISTSLCRVIFESPEVHDAASLITVLQADLTVLKELGFPGASATIFYLPRMAHLFVIHRPVGDRILRQKAVREAGEKMIFETEALLISSAPGMAMQEIPSSDPAMPAPSPQATPGNTFPGQTSKRSYGLGHLRQAFSSWLASLQKSKVIPSPSIPVIPPQAPGSTGPEQTPKRSYRFRRHRLPNRFDASSSWATSPLKGKVIPGQDTPERECLSSKPGPSRDSITPLSNICMSLYTDLFGLHLIISYPADSVGMAIKRCTPERCNLLRNLANNIDMAVKAHTPESDDLLLELANDINMTIDASVPESDNLLKRILNNVNAAIGASSSERDNLLRHLANGIGMAIEAGGNPPTKVDMKSLDERYCDVTGETMYPVLQVSGTFSLPRVLCCHLATSKPQVACVV